MAKIAPSIRLYGGPLDGAVVMSAWLKIDALQSFRVKCIPDNGTPPMYVYSDAPTLNPNAIVSRYFIRHEDDCAFDISVRWDAL